MRPTALLALLCCLALLSPVAFGDAPEMPWDARVAAEDLAVTHHSVTIDGQEIEYTATAGYLTLKSEAGEARANIFFMAYTRDDAEDPAERPLTFSFNGGPGSSSVWLHLGTLGPRRVLMDEEGFALPPPYRLVDNEASWLDLTDMVFIDPVSTGYSRAAEGTNPSDFHGYREDLRAVGEFIRLYITRHERWASPIFLIGESYGTTRAAGLSGELQSRHGIELNGVILVSPVLNFQTIRFHEGNDMPFWLFLPTYTATAYYHGRLDEELSRDLRATLDEVEQWAQTEYLTALALGDELPADRREEVVARLARYTGLSESFIENSNLRINIRNFTKELRRDEGKTVGRLDSRFTGRDRSGVNASPDYDPSLTGIMGPYTATLNDYVRRELNYANDLPYEILTGRVRPWSYASHQNQYLDASATLRDAMVRNPALKVLFACGYYDLATPHFAADYTIRQMHLPEELRGNVMTRYYESGHMMYIREYDLHKIKEDAAEFYDFALDR